MGMFDTLRYIEYCKVKGCDGVLKEFQTKDLNNCLDTLRKGDKVGNKLRYIDAHSTCDKCDVFHIAKIHVSMYGVLEEMHDLEVDEDV